MKRLFDTGCLKICIQTVTTCCTVYRSLRTPETVAKCYLKSIDTTIVKEMNEMAFFSSVSQCTRICSSVQSGDRNLCYAAAIRGMSGHKEQIGNNPSKYWFECFNCTFKLYAFFYFIHWHFCTLKSYSWKDNGQIWVGTTSNLSDQVPSRHQASGYTPPLLKLLKIRFFKAEPHIYVLGLKIYHISYMKIRVRFSRFGLICRCQGFPMAHGKRWQYKIDS